MMYQVAMNVTIMERCYSVVVQPNIDCSITKAILLETADKYTIKFCNQ